MKINIEIGALEKELLTTALWSFRHMTLGSGNLPRTREIEKLITKMGL